MKIGIDVDGVLANFVEGFTRLTKEITGRNLFPSLFENGEAPMWDWPQHFGYTEEEMAIVWNAVEHSTKFWQTLRPFFPNVLSLCHVLSHEEEHDVYLISARPGRTARWQTDLWIRSLYFSHIGEYASPAVLISSEKGLIARALNLEAYIDDRPENCLDVLTQSPATRVFLHDRNYNRTCPIQSTIRRVFNLKEMFVALESNEA